MQKIDVLDHGHRLILLLDIARDKAGLKRASQ